MRHRKRHLARKNTRMSLRVRLVVLLTLMLAAGSMIIGGLTHTLMAAKLWGQLDSSLAATIDRATSASGHMPVTDVSSQPVGTVVALVADGKFRAGPEVTDSVTGEPTKLSEADRKTIITKIDEFEYNPQKTEGITATLEIGDYRLLIEPVASRDLPASTVMVAGLPAKRTYATLRTLDLTMLVVSTIGVVLVGAVGGAVIRATMQPLHHVVDVADSIATLPLTESDVHVDQRVNRNLASKPTEIGRLGGALNRLLDNVGDALETRAASEMKMRRFVADASHELRTPLASIRGYAQLIHVTHELTPDGERSLERLIGQTENMTELVEQLLLLNRLEEGHATTIETVDMVQIAANVYLDSQAAFGEHTWEFDAFTDGDPAYVEGDPSQLARVLSNLASNAAKHTSAGTQVDITVGIEPTQLTHVPALFNASTTQTHAEERARSHNSGYDVVVRVHDTGEGIDPEFLPKVFDRLARADKARSGSTSTSGLGLAIVKAIAEAHQGTINVESEPGNTVFTIRLPYCPPPAAGAAKHRAETTQLEAQAPAEAQAAIETQTPTTAQAPATRQEPKVQEPANAKEPVYSARPYRRSPASPRPGTM